MRIAWVHTFDPDAELAGIFMHRLAADVARLGVELELIYAGRLRRGSDVWHAARRLRADTLGHDIVHAQYGSGCGFVCSFLPQPKVLTLRGSDWHTSGSTWKPAEVRRRLGGALTRASLRRYDAAIAVSNRMGMEVARHSPALRLEIIPSGVNLEEFRPVQRSIARARLGEGTNTNPWVLFSTVQATNPVKRTDLALAAFEAARQLVPTLELRIANGTSPSLMPDLINASNVVLLTSTSEGWPNIIKEALACDVPFVATDVSDLSTLASPSNHCFVSDPTPQSLGVCIVKSLRAPTRPSLRQYAEPMGLQQVASRLVGLYTELLAAKLRVQLHPNC